MNICLTCQNGYSDKCQWVKDCIPIEGMKYKRNRKTITYCPQYKKEFEKEICPACGKKFEKRDDRQKYCCAKCRKKYLSNKANMRRKGE